MLNRIVFICCFLFFGANIMKAQDIEVKKFEPLENNQTELTNYRNDNNGNPCALLLVQSLKENLEFEGWVVGDVERKDDVYMVFVANGAKHIKIKHADFQTKDVVFRDYGTTFLKGGLTYILQLENDTKDVINKVYSLGWNLNGMEVSNNAKTVLNMSARRGDVRAQIAMAQLSLVGKVRVEYGEIKSPGLVWIKKLLAAGDSTCLDSMPGELMYAYACQLIHDGISNDRSPNMVDTEKERMVYTDACQYYLKAILNGYNDSYVLFENYPLGNGLPSYSNTIIQICKDSASVGNFMAMNCLGYIYERGICEPVNLKEAAKWFSKANERNPSIESKTNLCRVYGNIAFPIDDESLAFIKNQSEDGLPEALFQMGVMYEEGRNFSIDIDKAIELYKLAKPTVFDRNRHHGATYRLANIYYERNEQEKALELLRGLYDDELDARYLLAVILYHDKRDYKMHAYNIFNDLSNKGYQKATDFIKNNY